MSSFIRKFPLFQLLSLILFSSISINVVKSSEIGDDESYKIIQTENGLVRGKKSFTFYEENPYFAFKGIPYAKPPINALRFKVRIYFIKRNNILFELFMFDL